MLEPVPDSQSRIGQACSLSWVALWFNAQLTLPECHATLEGSTLLLLGTFH